MDVYDAGIWIIGQLPPELQEMILDYVMKEYQLDWKSRIRACNYEYRSWWNCIALLNDRNSNIMFLERKFSIGFNFSMNIANYRRLNAKDYKTYQSKITNFITSQSECELPLNY